MPGLFVTGPIQANFSPLICQGALLSDIVSLFQPSNQIERRLMPKLTVNNQTFEAPERKRLVLAMVSG